MIRRPTKVHLVTHPDDPFSGWVVESCLRSGLMVSHHPNGEVPDLSSVRLIVLGGRGTLDARDSVRLADWVEMGGTVICMGSSWGLEPVLRLTPDQPAQSSRDWICPRHDSPWWPEGLRRAAFWGGARTKSAGADVLMESASGSVVLSRAGRWVYFAPHLGQTLGVLAMGSSVECDRVGPGDGSADTMDGELKSEDGSILDWKEDRLAPDGLPPAFREPWSDILSEIWMRVVLTACDSVAVEPLLCWPWPHGWEGVATVSIDFGDSDPGLAPNLLNTFAKFGIRAAWMAGTKGVPMDIVRLLKRGEQSVGLLYSGEGGWTNEDFRLEMLALARANGVGSLPTARPKNGGWRGWDRFYSMLSAAGCRVSLSKGGSQPGTSGCAFGTVRPFVPHSHSGRKFDVLEAPYCVSMPGTPPSLAAPLIDLACDWHGSFHVRLDLAACQEPGFERELQNLVMLLRQRRLLMLSPDQLGHYELNRRRIQTKLEDTGQGSLSCEGSLPGFTLLTSQDIVLMKEGNPHSFKDTTRFGRRMRSWSFDLEGKAPLRFSLSQARMAA